MGNNSMGRNTFYVSDYHLNKQSREFINQSVSRRQKRVYPPAINQNVIQTGVIPQDPDQTNFIPPRAKSRKGDAHIRIEVHKDQRIIHHLQGD